MSNGEGNNPLKYNLNLATYDTNRLFKMFDALTETERRILALRFGLDGTIRTLLEVGEIVNLVRSEVRIIEARAMKKLIDARLLDRVK